MKAERRVIKPESRIDRPVQVASELDTRFSGFRFPVSIWFGFNDDDDGEQEPHQFRRWLDLWNDLITASIPTMDEWNLILKQSAGPNTKLMERDDDEEEEEERR